MVPHRSRDGRPVASRGSGARGPASSGTMAGVSESRRVLPVRLLPPPTSLTEAAAVEQARAAAAETAGDPAVVGEHLGVEPEIAGPVTGEVAARGARRRR